MNRLIFLFAFSAFSAVSAAAPSGIQADRLQRAVDSAMAGKQGSAIVLDVPAGRLLASYQLDNAARRLVRPGSVIKPFTLLALQDAGLVRASTTIMCARTNRLSGRNLDCSHVQVDQPIDAVAALAYSCNSFFIRLAERVEPDALARGFEQAGLASRTGLAANEATGVVRRPSARASVQLMAVGEEGIEVTPLGLAAAYRKLAVRVRAGEAGVKLVADGMKDAARYGTARMAKPADISIGGKTGTASASDGGAAHAWFAGFVPADRPEIVVVVFLEHGSGGGDAAPVAGRILEAYR